MMLFPRQIALHLFILGLVSVAEVSANLVINELASSNRNSALDDAGDSSDWIELWNQGSEAISLDGWHFSDDAGAPQKWAFPAGTVVEAGEYLIIWASGRNLVYPSGQIHTGFSLGVAGEPLLLVAPDGEIADFVPATALRQDVSYGRSGDASPGWFFYANPTPGEANSTPAYEGIASPPVFSHPAGFYEAGFDLVISAGPGEVIHYSLDGTDPGPESLGTGKPFYYKSVYPRLPTNPIGPLLEGAMRSAVYSSPIPVVDPSPAPNALTSINTWFEASLRLPSGPVAKAQVVRARSFREGWIPSQTETRTYFVGPNVNSRFTLPIVSVSSSAENLFGYERGIYVPGKIADNWRIASPASNPPRWQIPGNYTQRGSSWERPVHLEILEPTGQLTLSKSAEAEIHGAASRDIYIKSLRLRFDGLDGTGDTAVAPVFPGLKRRGDSTLDANHFETLLLRNSGNDARGLLFRDAFIQHLVGHLPLDIQAYRPALQFFNGEFMGIINLRERMDASYILRHYEIDPDDSVILELWGGVDHGIPSDASPYSQMRTFATTQDLSLAANYEQMKSWMDVENHAIYHAFQIYIDNADWPGNNMKLWRKRTTGPLQGVPTGHDGRWRWMVYDTDIAMFPENTSRNTLARVAGGTDWTTLLFRRLLTNEDYRHDFINSVAEMRNSIFVPARVNRIIDEFVVRLDPARDAHFHRWQEAGPTFGGARNYASAVKTFAAGRSAAISQHVISQFGLAGEYALTVDAQGGGKVRVNRLTVEDGMPGHEGSAGVYPWTGVYFRGVPVKIKALPKPGHRFVGWAELPGETSVELELNLQADATYTALFEALPPQVTIHEWNFENPASYLEATSSIVPGATLTALPGPSTGYLQSTASQDFTSSHLRVNNPLGASFTWNLPSTGYEDLTLRFLTRRSGQGAGTQSLSYTVDGNNWILLDTYSVADAPPQEKSFDLSSLSATENNPQLAVRITFSQGTGGSTGNHRFDDFTLEGRPIAGLNQAPEIVGSLAGTHGVAGGDEVIIDLESLFDDPDGDTLSYQVAANSPAMADLEVDGDLLKVTLLKVGDVQLNITAHDLETASAPLVGNVLSYPAPKSLEEGDVIWRSWAANQAAGNFPEHMIFLQGEENDSLLETPMMRAYAIPLADAANPADADFPYAAASRTRINGLGDGGISWINTGRGRDLGAVLLAIDTRGVPTVKVGWTGGTVSPGLRSYAIRLQARIGTHGEFSDVTVGGSPLEYLRSETPGHRQVMMPVSLPPEWLGQPHVQLQWRYHQIGGISGARDMLSLDDIIITTDSGPRAYEAWRLLEFSDPSAREDDLVSGPAALSNGYPNLLRYALGASRDDDISSRLPSLAEISGDWHFRFPFDPGKGDIIYRVKSSSDLLDWSETIYDSSTSATAPGSDGFLSLPLGEEGGPERFFRLEIDRP
jgi:hypothetical protein